LKIFSKNNNNKIFNVCTLFSKIKKSDLENSKHLKFWYHTRFQYEKFNESEKSKIGDHLIYIFCAKLTEVFRELKNTVDLLIYILN
jgi:hypothetical protein